MIKMLAYALAGCAKAGIAKTKLRITINSEQINNLVFIFYLFGGPATLSVAPGPEALCPLTSKMSRVTFSEARIV